MASDDGTDFAERSRGEHRLTEGRGELPIVAQNRQQRAEPRRGERDDGHHWRDRAADRVHGGDGRGPDCQRGEPSTEASATGVAAITTIFLIMCISFELDR